MRRFPPNQTLRCSPAIESPHSSLGLRSPDKWIRGSGTPAASSEAKQRPEGAAPCVPLRSSGHCLASARAPCPRPWRRCALRDPLRVVRAPKLGALAVDWRRCVGETHPGAQLPLCSPSGFWATSLLQLPIQDNSRILGRTRGLLCHFCGRWASSSVGNKC